ncbi:hypothetical protein DPMN_101848 [Dreissena polymorpha]|uniref:Uncharacterized protein n=1 Tax=Dreissena polymorpha TaxID=45954 RepID=A0A9D4LI64_DREPO|nr:hypothetical protein DPMN_101848 [Dreissena polymorpha]
MRVVFEGNTNVVKEFTLAYGGMAVVTVMPTKTMASVVGRWVLSLSESSIYRTVPQIIIWGTGFSPIDFEKKFILEIGHYCRVK